MEQALWNAKLELTLTKYASGRYGFVGSGIPVDLAFVMKDGSPLDPDQLRIAAHCGPGFAKKMKGRSWATGAQAIADANALGVQVACPHSNTVRENDLLFCNDCKDTI